MSKAQYIFLAVFMAFYAALFTSLLIDALARAVVVKPAAPALSPKVERGTSLLTSARANRYAWTRAVRREKIIEGIEHKRSQASAQSAS